MRNRAIFLGTLLTFFMSTACDQLEKKKEEDAQSTPTELEGTWERGCTAETEGSSDTQYVIAKHVFQGSSITGSMDMYSDSACATKTMSIRLSGTHKIGDAVTSPSGAKKHEVAPSGGVYLTVHSAELVSAFNTGSFCGGGWEAGKEKQVTNALCKDSEGLKTIENTQYDIFKIDGTSLYYGEQTETNDGSTAEKIPTELEKKAFTKK